MSSRPFIRLADLTDLDGFADHIVRHSAESGREGSLHFAISRSPERASVREHARQRWERLHEVEEDRFLDGEQLRSLRTTGGGTARSPRDESELAENLARSQVGDGCGFRAVHRRREDLEDPALDDVESIALVALAKDDVARSELENMTLDENGPYHLVGLILEQFGSFEERRIDGGGHELGIDYMP